MSKILCDICGTAYPETAAQCPICGTAKSDAAKPAPADTAAEGESGYAYVRGGRFSHSNVKKRNAGKKELPRTVVPAKPKKEEAPAKQEKAPEKPQRQPRKQREERPSSNIGLIIIVIILVLAIIAVCAYIAMRFIEMRDLGNFGNPSTSTHSPAPSGNPSEAQKIPCTGLRLPIPSYTFTTAGGTLLLEPDVQPVDTTDKITYSSSDPYIATVDGSGMVTAVANGEVTITVRCGEHTAQCQITCTVGVDPVYPTTPPDPSQPTQPILPDVTLELNRKDFTLFSYGETWNVYSGELDPALITWTTGDPNVVTIENGIVTAVGSGTTKIYAEYQGQKVSCTVHCSSNVVKPADSLYELQTNFGTKGEFTIYVGGTSVTVQLIEKETGRRIQASELTFSVSREGFFTVNEKGVVTAVKSNYGYYDQYVIVEYNGETFKMIVRVRNP